MNDNNTTSQNQALESIGSATDVLKLLSTLGVPLSGTPGRYLDVIGKVSEYLAYGKDAATVATSDDIGREIFGIIGEAIGGGIGGAAGGALVGGGAALALGNDGDVFGAILGLIVGGAVGTAGGWYVGKEYGKDQMQDLYDYLMSLPKYQELTDAQRMELAQLMKAGVQPWEYQPNGVDPDVNSLWHAFKNWVAPRRDPLVLDLDGDGIETLGITSTTQVLFDYDGDGVKTGTGWIKGDDGFVVLDRNGNGTIDNGGELFGDQTLVNGVKAVDGFAALSAEDSNKNSKFDAGDTNFTKVRIWQDTNSDGISQAGELHTLNELGTPQGGFSCFAIHLLTSINLTSTTSNNQNFNNTRRVA
jgi:hypothetical protein